MPWPTKPACSGSWPEPPPEISATLPGLSVRAPHELALLAERRRCRRARPRSRRGFRRARCRGVDQLLHVLPPRCAAGLSDLSLIDVARTLRAGAPISASISSAARFSGGIAEVRQLDHYATHRGRSWSTTCEPAGMGARDRPAGRRRARPARSGRSRRSSRDAGPGSASDRPGLVICEMKLRFLPSAAASRWRVPDGRLSSTALQDALVGGDRLDAGLDRSRHVSALRATLARRSAQSMRQRDAAAAASHRGRRRDGRLGAASSAGATDKVRTPASSSAGMARGSPPASPHRLTSRPSRAPCAATCGDQPKHGRDASARQAPPTRRCRAPRP